MQHILRCDYEACRQYLMNLEQAVVLEQNLQMLQTFISHRCDGNRNILHACVSVCFPTSNKETKEEEGEIKNYNMIFKRNLGQFWKYKNYWKEIKEKKITVKNLCMALYMCFHLAL